MSERSEAKSRKHAKIIYPSSGFQPNARLHVGTVWRPDGFERLLYATRRGGAGTSRVGPNNAIMSVLLWLLLQLGK